MQQAQTGPLAQKAAETSAAMQQQEQTSPEMQELIAAMQQQREQTELKQKLDNYKQWEQQFMACGGCIRHAGGGSIHIDPSKKGTFTAAASRHGMGVQQFAAHVHAHPENYSPAMRKKANFARNAAKWHHAFGGPLNAYGRGGTLSHQDGMIKSILDRYLTDYRITSAYRGKNNRVGKLGGKSAHAYLLDDGSSAALDIVSSNMNRLRQELANPQLQKELAAAGFGILDETDPATMKRTGATGAHFHVGRGIKGGGFHLNGYGHQSAEAPLPSYMASSGGGLMTITSPSQQQAGPTPWWLANRQEPEAIPEPTSIQPEVAPVGLTPDMFMLDWDPVNGRHTSETATYPRLFAEGGFTDIASMIKAHEGFSPTAYKDGKSQSIGYGFYKHGIAQGIDFNRRMSRAEADAILDSNIAVIKGELHKELGAEKYNSLTDGQLAAFVDTWYQSPKAAKKAARIYKRTGDLDAAAKALAVPGFTKRNADRQAAFYGGFSMQATSPQDYSSSTTTRPGELITLTQPNQTQQGFTPWWQNAYNTQGIQEEPRMESFNPLTLNVSPDFFKLNYDPIR